MADVNPASAAPPPKPRSRPGPIRWIIAVVLLILAGWAGWHTYRVFHQRRTTERIDELGGVVAYDFEYIDPDDRSARPEGPSPIAGVLGNDYTQNIVDVNIGSTAEGKLSDDDLEQIASLPEVLNLSISNGGDVTDDGLRSLASMPKVRRLKLANFPNVTDSGLAVLADLPNVRRIEIANFPKITDAALAHLAELGNLRELVVSGCKINGSGLQHVDAQSLRLVEITACQVNDEAFQHLADASSLEELSLGKNEVKGSGLSELKGLPKLIWLRLGENPLDPAAAVPNLKLLTNLELLNLRSTPIDRGAAEELSKALPECDISIEGGSYDPELKKWDFQEAATQE